MRERSGLAWRQMAAAGVYAKPMQCALSTIAYRKGWDLVDIKPLFGLGGVLIAAMASESNDQVTAIALIDVRGALGISHDSGTWIESLYVWAEIVGMAISPWLMAKKP
jgi:hypothetical protein